MTEYLLVVQICASLMADCFWMPTGLFKTEALCIANGLGGKFRCLKVEQPDQVPLPRPRPAKERGS